MFCPLCKAEFREGFTQCSDCHLPLVATREEASLETVATAWKGGDKSQLESVLSALQQAEIPLQFREHLNVRGAARAGLLRTLLVRMDQGHDTEFEVRVLGRDVERARVAVLDALDRTGDD